MKRLLTLFCALAVALLLAFPAAAADEAGKVYNLRMQVLQGPDMLWLYKPFVDYAKKASNGRLNIQLFAADQLVPTDQMMQACATGTIDIANGSPGYWADAIPAAGAEGVLPFGLRNINDVNTVFYQRGLLELFREAYAKHDVYYLGPQMTDFAFLMAKKPVRTLDDMKKMKFRAVQDMSRLLGNVGVSAQYVPAAEVYLQISTGILDGVLYGGAVAADGFSYQKVAPYFMVPALKPAMDNMIMSMKTFKSLPPDLQEIMELAARAHNLYVQTANWALEFETRERMKKNDGLQIVEMSPELVASLTEAAMKQWEEVAATDPLAKKAVDIIKTYCKEAGYL